MPNQGPSDRRRALLERINEPADLRQLSEDELPQLAAELRDFLIETVSRTGGHLAAGLGVVELTIALHYTYDTPDDRLVWDVGHQAYPHKILTGRRDRMSSLRQQDGLSGFPRREESEYDTFGTGHSSTSVSAALGMALAAKSMGETRRSVAVIGDGALSGGMAFEAFNHAGSLEDIDLLVILNDNDMSISQPVGAVSNYLSRVLTSRFYNRLRDTSRSALRRAPSIREFADRWEEHMKGMVLPGTLWEELGFRYIGPVDGHDLPLMIENFRNLQQMRGPRLLHVVTQKGKGFQPAEGQPIAYHGVSPFDPSTGKLSSAKGGVSYTGVFSDWVCDAASADDRLWAITPAMREGSGLVKFSERYPQRYVDVGIAEQHAVTLAAGMACDGLKPVVAIYSTFLQRAYDQLIHDVALQNLDVTFAVDRAGQVGADGATHAGSFDLTYARAVPNMVVMAPSDEAECRLMLQTALEYEGPALVRYPRGKGPGAEVPSSLKSIPIGRGSILRQGQGIALLAFGTMVAPALEAAEELGATVADMRFVKPLDRELVARLAEDHDLLVTIEENVIQGGAGTGVGECLAEIGKPFTVRHLGLPDTFIEHASQEEQLESCGLTSRGIVASVSGWVEVPSGNAVEVSAVSKKP